MKTSYFANLRHLKSYLSISQYPPKWYDGPQLKMLAPPPALLKAAHNGLSHAEYEKQYKRDVLDHLDAQEVYDAITDEYGDDVALLCFEKPGDFCHRRLVAQWLETELKVAVPEWEPKPKSKMTLQF